MVSLYKQLRIKWNITVVLKKPGALDRPSGENQYNGQSRTGDLIFYDPRKEFILHGTAAVAFSR